MKAEVLGIEDIRIIKAILQQVFIPLFAVTLIVGLFVFFLFKALEILGVISVNEALNSLWICTLVYLAIIYYKTYKYIQDFTRGKKNTFVGVVGQEIIKIRNLQDEVIDNHLEDYTDF